MKESPIEQIKPQLSESDRVKISLKPEDMMGKFHIDESKKKEGIKEKAKKELIGRLSQGYIYYKENSLENRDNVRPDDDEDRDSGDYDDHGSDQEWEEPQYDIPDDVKFSPEVQQAALNGVGECLLGERVEYAIKIKKTFDLPNEIIYSSEEIEAVEREMIRRALRGDFEGVEEAIDMFFSRGSRNTASVRSPEAERAMRQTIMHILSDGYVDRAEKMKERFSFSMESLSLPEVQSIVGAKMFHILSEDYFDSEKAIKLKNDFYFPDENVQKVCKDAIIQQLLRGRTAMALQIKKDFSLPNEAFLSPEVQEVAKSEVVRLISRGGERKADYILKEFFLPTSVFASAEIQNAAKRLMIDCLRGEDIDRALIVKKTFAVSDEIFASPEVQNAAKEAMFTRLTEKNYNYIDQALEIKEKFLLSAETVQNAAKRGIQNRLFNGSVDNAIEIRDKFSVPVNFISTPEIQNAAKAGMVKCLSKGNIDSAVKIRNQFPVPLELLLSQDVQEAIKVAFLNSISQGHINTYNRDMDDIKKIRDNFPVPPELISSPEAQQSVKKSVIEFLLKGENYIAIEIKEGAPLSVENASSSEVQNAAKICIANELSKGHINEARKTQGQFAVPPELIQQAAKKGMINLLSTGKIYEVSNVISEYSIPAEVISSSEVQDAAKKGVAHCLASGDVARAFEIIKKLSLPIEAVILTARQELIKHLENGNSKNAVNIKNGFPLLNDFIFSVEVQDATRKGIVKLLSSGSIESAVHMRDSFTLSVENTETAASEGLLARMTNQNISNYLDDSMKIKDSFSLSDEICREVAKDGMSHTLTTGNIDYAIRIQEKFALSDEDTSQVSKQAFLKCLAKNKIETAEKIREKFKVSVNSEDIFNVIPEMRTLLSSLRGISPEFVSQAEKTPDLLLSLVEFRNNPDIILNVAKENPFLLDAIANNPRFGSRLLVKYRQFDVAAKENIKTQFAFKKKIMAEHPDIDPQSVEFRMLMQDSLKGFLANKEVIEYIDERGINSERWLNYDETAYFNLGSNENTLAFSEIITTPIGRIRETIDTYAYTIKDVLKEYRDELLKFEIKLGVSEAPTKELQKMMTALEKARAEGNTKKISGIEKGIENLKSKSSQEKKGVLWEKLLADVASFQRLKDDVFKSQEIFVATEQELADALAEKMPSGKKIQDIKRKIATAKEDLRSKFMVMERRIEEFRANLKNMIAPALGGNRADAVIQEIDTKLAEQFNHFDADRSMLKNLFSGQSDKKKEEMESRPMSIFVWTRDPDIDLYQGNYSPCCICIDSSYHGAESPIADYNTDLGIQIVNIWDETKNEPITAAWCWLGEDEDGKPALIVDNIECNTLFSANFSEQLTKELFSYLEDYAKAIGVKKIVLGKANNDMPTAGELSKMTDNNGKYSKIGGANRSDGYFLEAEDVNVKIVWEKGKKVNDKKEEAKKNKSNIDRIVFDEVNVQALAENDFSSIRDLEQRVYANDDALIQGQGLVQDIKDGNGLEYSVAIWGVAPGSTKKEMIAYAVAVNDETDEGDKSVYLEDIAVAPEAQRQGIGWKLIDAMVQRLKLKANNEGKPILFDMHLRPNSLSMLDAHRNDFTAMGIEQIEDVLVPDYYDEGEDAVYRVYEIVPTRHV